MAQIYYGRQAYEGFAKAFAKKVGVSVSISNSVSSPSVNAQGEITLPAMDKYQTAPEFEDTCASIIHEISHVYYGSHLAFASAQSKERLWKECFNAVLDVADETGISIHEINNGSRRAEQLLVNSCIHAKDNNEGLQEDYGQFQRQGKQKPPDHWRILSMGIIKARINGQRSTRVIGARSIGNWVVREYSQVDVKAVFGALASARPTLKSTRVPNKHSHLIKLTDKLVKLLEPVKPPEADSSTNSPDFPGGMGLEGGYGPADPNAPSEPNAAVNKGKDALPNGAIEATEQDGAGVVHKRGDSAATGQPAPNSPGGTGGQRTARFNPSQQAYDTCLPVIKRIADRLATDGEAINSEDGYRSGMGVTQPHRAFTDGACMGRWVMDDHADGMAVAILLDSSSSMHPMGQVAGVAEAFSKGLSECAVVKRWSFADWCSQQDNFMDVKAGGGTKTQKAIQAAREWLATQPAGQKLIVCLTDGEPYDIPATQAEVRQAISEGVKVIGVGIGDRETFLAISKSMPMSTVVNAEDVNRLAIQLEGITLQM